ncbi:MAG TPA: molybdopterin dehydrogenase [Lachnospiraceae bacterium]|nr:molybdopterin dehydrogenase [Lachnospiraceae bacterium]
MLTIKNYVKAQSLSEAYELNQKRSNRIIGGMLWMKMSNTTIQTAIDLSGLGLDKIEETKDEFSIGCMVTLRQLEQHKQLNLYTDGAIAESVKSIVGVQFRNLATVGGSIFGRYGFSDVLTMFLALDTQVELFKGGIVSLADFINLPLDNDILVRLIVKKAPLKSAYLSVRNSKTDFPVLACSVACLNGNYRAVIGARPGKAVLVEVSKSFFIEELQGNANAFADYVTKQITTGSNMRASAEYRKLLANVLTRRGCEKVLELMKAGGKKK